MKGTRQIIEGTMTAQEIYEREGFLVCYAGRPRKIGEVIVSDPGAITGESQLVIVEEITLEQAESWRRRNGIALEDPMRFSNFYKVIAE